MKKQNLELLIGVADFKSAIAAVKNGADAVYFGVKGYNMRDLGTNFKKTELKKLMKYLHENNVKGYLALNTTIYPEELKDVKSILKTAKNSKVDAVIASDLGVMSIAQDLGVEIHVSTQSSISNELTMKQYKKLGAERIVLARELNMNQVKKITKIANKLGVEVEAFIHGAMCIAVSGRCFMSHDVFGRSANRGECLQVCRRTFHLKGKNSPDEEKCNCNSLEEAEAFFIDGSPGAYEKKSLKVSGNTILSAKDMKTIEILDKIIATGITSLKVEGRTKPVDYIGAVTRCYREAIDSIKNKTYTKEKIKKWDEKLASVYNRKFSTGFWKETPGKEEFTDIEGSNQTKKKKHLGQVRKYYAKAEVCEVKLIEPLKLGEKILFEGVTTYLEQKVESMQINHKEIKFAKKGQVIGLKVKERVRKNDNVFGFIENN
jgi:putative protease